MSKLNTEDEETDRKYQEAIMKMAEEGIMHPTAQQIHDFQMPDRIKLDKGSRQRLEALLAEKKASSEAVSQSKNPGPIAQAMKDNPGLTREKALKMAEDYGF